MPGALQEPAVVQRASLTVYLGVARQLGEKDRGLRDEVAVDEGEDGEGGDGHCQRLPVYEGPQQIYRNQAKTSEGSLYLEQNNILMF